MNDDQHCCGNCRHRYEVYYDDGRPMDIACYKLQVSGTRHSPDDKACAKFEEEDNDYEPMESN